MLRRIGETFYPAAAVSIQSARDTRHREEIEIPEKGEIKRLRAKLEELAGQTNQQRAKAWRRYRALIETAIHTGMRASELRGLPWDAVNLKAGTIEGAPARGRERRDRLPQEHLEPPNDQRSGVAGRAPAAVESRVSARPLAFPNWQGEVEALANIHTRAWKPLQVAADIIRAGTEGLPAAKYRFHDLRHFHASHLIADGTNPKEVMVEMGHATIAITMDVYGSLFRDDDAEQERRDRAERLANSL